MDNVDLLLSGNSAAGGLAGLSALLSNASNQNAQLQNQQLAMQQQNMQFMLSLDASTQQRELTDRQMTQQSLLADRQLTLQQQESAFDQLNKSLDHQLKVSAQEEAKRDKAFERTLMSKRFDLETKSMVLQLKGLERQERVMQQQEDGFTVGRKMDMAMSSVVPGDYQSHGDSVATLSKLIKDNPDAILPPGVRERALMMIQAQGQIAPLADLNSVMRGTPTSLNLKDTTTVFQNLDLRNGADSPNELAALSFMLGGVSVPPNLDTEKGANVMGARILAKYGKDSAVTQKFFEMANDPVARENLVRIAQSGILDKINTPAVRDELMGATLDIERAKNEALAAWRVSPDSGNIHARRAIEMEAEERKKEVLFSAAGVRDPSVLRLMEGPNQLTAKSAMGEIESVLGVLEKGQYGKEGLRAKLAMSFTATTGAQPARFRAAALYNQLQDMERLAASQKAAGGALSDMYIKALVTKANNIRTNFPEAGIVLDSILDPGRWLGSSSVRDADMWKHRAALTGEDRTSTDYTKRNTAVIFDYYKRLGITALPNQQTFMQDPTALAPANKDLWTTTAPDATQSLGTP